MAYYNLYKWQLLRLFTYGKHVSGCQQPVMEVILYVIVMEVNVHDP